MAVSDVRILGLDGVEMLVTRFQRKAKIPLYSALSKFVLDIRNDVVERSPVDSGDYKGDWDMKKGTSSGSAIEVRLTNERDYAGVMEEGSEPGARPWPSPGPKTVLKNGRIWSRERPEPVAQVAIENANWDYFSRAIEEILR